MNVIESSNFIVGIFLSDQYANIKSEMLRLGLAMKIQFENSRKEFCSEEFLEEIKPEAGNLSNEEDDEEDGKLEGVKSEAVKKNTQNSNPEVKKKKKKGFFSFLLGKK